MPWLCLRTMAYVTERQSALPDAKRDPKMDQLNSPWPTYGGRPSTLWVYLVPFGRYTWERACLKTAKSSFREISFGSRDQTDGVGT